MSLKPIQINVKSNHENQNINDKYNGLELINLSKNFEQNELMRKKTSYVNGFKSKPLKDISHLFLRINKYITRSSQTLTTQSEVFTQSVKYLMFCSKCCGFFPMIDTSSLDQKRYHIISWRSLLALITIFGQLASTLICFYKITLRSIDVHIIMYFSLFFTNLVFNILFIRLSYKWGYIMERVATSDLNEYVDSSVARKCNVAVIGMLSLGFVENCLDFIKHLAIVRSNYPDDPLNFEYLMKLKCSWMFDNNIKYTQFLGLFGLALNLLLPLSWNLGHLFIICASYYLASILEQINKKIMSHEGQYLPASFYRALREDYNKATRLIRDFDDVINSITFVCFACNLFYICLLLYYFLSADVSTSTAPPEINEYNVTSARLFEGHVRVVSLIYSLSFVILRSSSVSLIGAKVHSASLVAAPSLYNIPSPSYCTETQRFIEQLHGDTVALTGLNFFYVTRELVLSVVGTIVTYELVMLQFNGGY